MVNSCTVLTRVKQPSNTKNEGDRTGATVLRVIDKWRERLGAPMGVRVAKLDRLRA